LIVPVDGITKDHFPRRDTSIEKLTKLKPAFDRRSGRGTLTAGNSSPLTDGAARNLGGHRGRLGSIARRATTRAPRGFRVAAVDIFNEGLLMAPVSAIPRVLARRGLKFNDIALWEIHEAFSAQVLCHIKALEDKNFVREKAGVEHISGSFPRDRMNPNGGSVAGSPLRRHRSTHTEPSS
jgi:acetyl-CoA C-acetyltransferase